MDPLLQTLLNRQQMQQAPTSGIGKVWNPTTGSPAPSSPPPPSGPPPPPMGGLGAVARQNQLQRQGALQDPNIQKIIQAAMAGIRYR